MLRAASIFSFMREVLAKATIGHQWIPAAALSLTVASVFALACLVAVLATQRYALGSSIIPSPACIERGLLAGSLDVGRSEFGVHA